ncbi:bifunctional 5,10-methylenetetrahydrofolate dehydrogenase/5,10-methenyltetrahydrofolate cyclohydrolase [Mycolicibacterium wolinskyi]|uniref:Bifunctional protein FolD n=1 Tax=Mycolicibacterium wolinskyi TaxID=59750 RepID=A0A1X2F8A7_9MYCO|nr:MULTISPECIES: bifunctional 5,10-methylenetetrahydrofolate dehydrogenase/5,10-methenyltetrahydrofolate cyclohydrolase [Mycolicibacterium]MCV7286663.1 bifunctional 5,10-methylenetetrahydrofolate dehydrogenase/5,10-methenyltetrahydrofolate cyclohydrolase [Mycolicibacterium wolinskyi]MCV7293643.1 bifunctional 5,10-methylenetetrahydrofolate dehydrogenase/5,10-methenyltetrahydrofolate cyclohydrolase [Mycolicibacterium goodii]ORX14634.1 bifunctional 5,10-methylene-tetrahydrofolate dehydrogenase/5,10
MTTALSGSDLATAIRSDVASRAATLAEYGVVPKLAVVTATDDESTAWYVRSIAGAAKRTGIACDIADLGPTAGTAEIGSVLAGLSADPDVHGVILQTPLPRGTDLAGLRSAIAPDKDIDGTNPVSLGRLFTGQRAFAPATAQAVLTLLDHHSVDLRGKTAAVVGRSIVVGTPVAHMLVQRDATVTICHRHTTDLAAQTSRADVVVAAVGVPGLLTTDHIGEGAIVIDVGTTATADGRLLGDVDAAAVEGHAGGLTPVPGGVGPVTTALLLANTVTAATNLTDAIRADIGSAVSV